jgi:hypothetical protein
LQLYDVLTTMLDASSQTHRAGVVEEYRRPEDTGAPADGHDEVLPDR